MLLARALALGAAAALLAGCWPWGGDEDGCELTGTEPLGLVFADEAGAMHDASDGTAVPLLAAPQGGHILLVGPRVQRADACAVQVNAALRDPASNRVLGLEERPISLQPRGDGWIAPSDPAGLSDLANVAVCPSVLGAIDGGSFQLEVKLLDGDGAVIAETAATVAPTCSDDYCRSDCGTTAR